MLDKVIKAINQFNMNIRNGSVCVALSGGADSVALCHSLFTLKDELGITLTACHFNHQIRGAEADRDQKFCEDFCKSLGIKLFLGSADVPLFAKQNKLSLETAARKLRYEFFSKLQVQFIATAHTQSDNLETVIFNLARGTGSDGICGIPPVRGKFVRPLILASRSDVENYIKQNGLAFVNDSTNFVDDCSRNIIRHKIVPVLKEINSAVEKNVSETSRIVFEETNDLRQKASKVLNNAKCENGIYSVAFSRTSSAVTNRALREYYFSFFGTYPDSKHLYLMADVLKNGGRVSVRGNYVAECKNGIFCFKKPHENKQFLVNVSEKGNNLFENDKKINSLLLKNSIDCDKIKGNINLRTREAGDKIRLANKSGTKSFKKLYNEYKIPLEERENLPVISDDDGPLWIYKIGVADRCAVRKDTKRLLTVSVTELLGGNNNE